MNVFSPSEWFLVINGDPVDMTTADNIIFAALTFQLKHDLKESISELTEHVMMAEDFENYNPSLVPESRLRLD
jgi:hypothetical protein